jgi:hypothetical protein
MNARTPNPDAGPRWLVDARSAESVWTLFSEDRAWFSYGNDMRVALKP